MAPSAPAEPRALAAPEVNIPTTPAMTGCNSGRNTIVLNILMRKSRAVSPPDINASVSDWPIWLLMVLTSSAKSFSRFRRSASAFSSARLRSSKSFLRSSASFCIRSFSSTANTTASAYFLYSAVPSFNPVFSSFCRATAVSFSTLLMPSACASNFSEASSASADFSILSYAIADCLAESASAPISGVVFFAPAATLAKVATV